MSIQLSDRSYKFIFIFDGIPQTLFKNINNLNKEFTYIPGSIENIIIDKYVMYFSGDISITPETNQITIEIPVIQS